MKIVDTHCHTGTHKYEPIESLIYQMDACSVDQAILIQHAGETDNAYHVQCMGRFPGRFASAMIVSPEDDGRHIRHWAERGIVGIRLPADSRAHCADPLAQWRTAAELDLVVSTPCTPSTLLGEEFTEVINLFPNLHICIEHLGGVGLEAQAPYEAFRAILALAERETLSIKLPGFGEFCPLPYPFSDVAPLADMTIEAFCPDRVMWGSDYPPVSTREGYAHSLEFPMQYFSKLSEEDRAWIFGRSAQAVWRLAQN